jgi:hypothetical protein
MISIKPPASMARVSFVPMHPGPSNEQRADQLRTLALVIEEALEKRKGGVSFDVPTSNMIKHSLMDLADRVELD